MIKQNTQAQPKNRPGQRARQARHEKEQARKEKKERIKKLKEAGITIDPNFKEKQREKWAKEQKEREKEYYKRQRENNSKEENGGYQGGRGGSPGKAKKVNGGDTIHSSWEAAKIRKEKEKEIMSLPFQGKRKVFGDNDDDTEGNYTAMPTTRTASNSSSSNSASTSSRADQYRSSKPDHMQKIQTKSTINNSNDGGDNVHPSWAAKQAQAAKLAGGFQGTKIKFNTDDSD